MTRVSLLPPNKTLFEDALDLTGARVDELPVDIDKVVRPYEIPLPLLPWLAWGLSADLWRERWSEEKRRNVTASAFPDHRLKGTLALHRKYISIMGGELLEAITPPQGFYPDDDISEEQWAAWRERFPQLRLYPYHPRPYEGADEWHTDLEFGSESGAYLDIVYPSGGTPDSLYVRAAELWHDGAKVADLTTLDHRREDIRDGTVALFTDITLPPVQGDMFFCDDTPGLEDWFLGDQPEVAERRVAVRQDLPATEWGVRAAWNTVHPGLDPISIIPTRIYESYIGSPTAMVADGWVDDLCHAEHDPAADYIYERWYLYDPDIAPMAFEAETFLDDARLGIDDYTAELYIQALSPADVETFGDDVSGFLAGDEVPEIRDDVLTAAARAKSLRDAILVSTRSHRVIDTTDRIRVGAGSVGDVIRSWR